MSFLESADLLGHCSKCSSYYVDHCCLNFPNCLSALVFELFFILLVFLVPDVAITWYRYIYQYGFLYLSTMTMFGWLAITVCLSVSESHTGS